MHAFPAALAWATMRALSGRLLVLLAAVAALHVQAAVPNPVVTGPVASTGIPGDPARNYAYFSTTHDLPTAGYIEQEFFIEGTGVTLDNLARGYILKPDAEEIIREATRSRVGGTRAKDRAAGP